MSKHIDEKHGAGTTEQLLERTTLSRKYTNEELIQLTQYYNKKRDELHNKHC